MPIFKNHLMAGILCIGIIIIVYSTSLLKIESLPDTFFTSKEIGLLFSVTAILSCLIVPISIIKTPVVINFLIIDILIVLYLIGLPLAHFFFYSSVSLSASLIQISYGLIYLFIRVTNSYLRIRTVCLVSFSLVVLIFIIQLLIGLGQYITLIPAYYQSNIPTGFFSNPAPFGIMMASYTGGIFVLWIYAILTKKHILFVLIFLLLLLSGAVLIFLTESRSAWLGLIFGITLPLLILQRQRVLRSYFPIKKPIIFTCSILFIIILTYFYYIKPDSANGRILIWISALNMIKNNTVFGVGLGNFFAKYIYCQSDTLTSSTFLFDHFSNYASDVRYAFNDLLHSFAETGLFGFFLMISIFYFVIKNLLIGYCDRKEKLIRFATILNFGVLVVIGVAGLTSYPMQSIPVATTFWLAMAFFVSLSAKGQIRKKNIYIYKHIKFKYATLLICFFVIIFYGGYTTIRARAYLEWNYLEHTKSKRDNYADMVNLYPALSDCSAFLISLAKHEEAKYNFFREEELLRQSVSYSSTKELYYALGQCYERLNNFTAALKCYSLIQSAMPGLMKPRYLKVILYYKIGDRNKFIKEADEALSFNPKKYNQQVVEMKRDIKRKLESYYNQ